MIQSKTIKYLILSLSVGLLFSACSDDGKNGASSENNLLSEDYIFIEPIPEPTPPSPEPTPTPPSPEPTPTPPSPDNTIPIAHAGDDQAISTSKVVTLDGSRSYDADDDPLTYKWTIVEKPSNSTAVLSNDTDIYPKLTVDKDGLYRIRLVVNDGKDNSKSDYVFITLNAPTPQNTPPTAIAEGSTNVVVKWHETNTVILDGSKSVDDGLINPLTYSWQSGPYIVNKATVQANTNCSDDWQRCYNADQRPICSFNVTLTVFDGEFSDTDSVNIKVDYSACENQPIIQPNSIHLDPAYTQTIPVSKHKTYKLWAYYDDGSTKDVTADAVLSTSNTNIAIIKTTGEVTGISIGDVLIIAEYAGQRDTAPLTVTD